MIVKDMSSSKVVQCPKKGFTSYRYLLKSDNMGFTLTQTHIPKGGWQFWHYTRHMEACMCIEGEGILHDVLSDNYYMITPGTMYALNNNDPHKFKANTDVTLICVFSPPLLGDETHKKDGSY